jgi:hypothetical protein
MLSWLKQSVTGAISLLLIGSVFSQSSLAQVPDDSQSAGLVDSTLSAEELAVQGGDSLTEKYEDIAREYGGYRRSSNLFGTNASGGSAHPGLSVFGIDQGLNPHNVERNGGASGGYNLQGLGLAALDLSVDDEITSSSVASSQNLVATGSTQTISDSFLQNINERDKFLDSYETARSIAIMTLSYLDKTVAAGLATSKSQADSDSIQQLLKQMNKNIARIAHPEKARFFDDQDEKFETCMRSDGSRDEIKNKSIEFVPLRLGQEKPPAILFDTYEGCRLGQPMPKFCGGMEAFKSSKYHFCSCCAESSTLIAKSTVTTAGGRERSLVSGEGFSLVDRVFMGVTVPAGKVRFEAASTSTNGAQNRETFQAGNALLDFSTMARSLYGDILYTNKYGIGNGSGGDGPPTNKFTLKMATPLLTVQQWVHAIRDFDNLKGVHPYSRVVTTFSKANDAGVTCVWEHNEGMWLRYCPSFGSAVRWGIYPALKQLIRLERDNDLDEYVKDDTAYSYKDTESGPIRTYSRIDGSTFTRADAVKQMWSEASLGGVMLTRADLKTMAELEGTSDGDRIIAAFCDTSAVEAVKRLHRKMNSLANDYIAANRKATANDKGEVLALIKRVDDQLHAGTDDSRSKVDELLIALDMQRDRRREALRASLVATGNASERAARRIGSLYHCFGGACAN